jgi:DNA-binding XRE family transcriptional regulator
MTDTKLLEERIDASGMKPNELAAAWGVSLPTYYKLKSGESEFTASMIETSRKIFRLTKAQRDAIFFAE